MARKPEIIRTQSSGGPAIDVHQATSGLRHMDHSHSRRPIRISSAGDMRHEHGEQRKVVFTSNYLADCNQYSDAHHSAHHSDRWALTTSPSLTSKLVGHFDGASEVDAVCLDYETIKRNAMRQQTDSYIPQGLFGSSHDRRQPMCGPLLPENMTGAPQNAVSIKGAIDFKPVVPFPWTIHCMVGRFNRKNGSGLGTGIMVGPRHVLTASHVMPWTANGKVAYITFTPGYFAGTVIGGNAAASWVQGQEQQLDKVYYYTKVGFVEGVGPVDDWHVKNVPSDFVVVVLKKPASGVFGYPLPKGKHVGDLTGWAALHHYKSLIYDNTDQWTLYGYPGGPYKEWSAELMVRQQNVKIVSSYSKGNYVVLNHMADTLPGHSGGPMLSWINGKWSVVGVHSWGNSSEFVPNLSAGCSKPMIALVETAKKEHP